MLQIIGFAQGPCVMTQLCFQSFFLVACENKKFIYLKITANHDYFFVVFHVHSGFVGFSETGN